MNTASRIAVFVAALAAAFGIGAGVGALVGPLDVGGTDPPPSTEPAVEGHGEH